MDILDEARLEIEEILRKCDASLIYTELHNFHLVENKAGNGFTFNVSQTIRNPDISDDNTD